ncbi:hypothetical protein [Ferruginibacter albus]|uniref:hypothetical protein n=1 Tax=Ferruginibacter albus TaxID=2875540 RepID=UPI001CC6F094|nr:hypothetical protein [Ferruginibacter albus]UAY53186.1 hypothetical protein K9M53_05820 [Ferruginibacter albus]
MPLKFKFENEGKTNDENEKPESLFEKYETASTARSLCILDTKGVYKIFFYNELSYIELDPKKDILELTFHSQKVILKGKNLKNILNELQEQKLMKIVCVQERYATIKKPEDVFITEISIK